MNSRLKKWLTALMVVLLPFSAIAQLQTVNWYFGDSAGLAFGDGYVKVLHNSGMFASEGSASISDSQGNLLFYTNGVSVWGSNHKVLPDGDSLAGSLSSRQGAMFIPRPGHDSLYYLFIADSLGEGYGLSYSLINRHKQNGYGDITEKNRQLYAPTTERLTGTIHQNGRDFWVVSHHWQTDSFFVYPVTPDGIGEPVISEAGTTHSFQQNVLPAGSMKISPDGKYLAMTVITTFGGKRLVLLNFNNATGKLQKVCAIDFEVDLLSGLAFSANAQKLYVSSTDSVYQLDMSYLPDTTAYKQSRYMIKANEEQADYDFGALQLAPNGKIYHTRHPELNQDPILASCPYLNAIQQPYADTSACNYQTEAIDLSPGGGVFGLPAFLGHWFRLPGFIFNRTCLGDTTHFRFLRPFVADSVSWLFPENAGELLYTSQDSAGFVFSRADTFSVGAVIHNAMQTDTQRQEVIVRPLPQIALAEERLICGTDSLTMDATPLNQTQSGYGFFGTHSYTWQSLPDTTAKVTVSAGGKYRVAVESYWGCSSTDTVKVKHGEVPVFHLGDDTIACYPDTVYLDPETPAGNYLWQDQSTEPEMPVSTKGTYWLHFTDTLGCSYADTIAISFYHAPNANFPDDTTLCLNETLKLSVKHPENAEIAWHDGSTGPQFVVRKPGQYFVTAHNKCGTTTDTARINYRYCGPIKVPNVFTPNHDGRNDYFHIKGALEMNAALPVYNRWGRQVYCSGNYRHAWQGKGLPEGVYYYILEIPERNKTLKGFLHLLR